jgi:hypothetical protein
VIADPCQRLNRKLNFAPSHALFVRGSRAGTYRLRQRLLPEPIFVFGIDGGDKCRQKVFQ